MYGLMTSLELSFSLLLTLLSWIAGLKASRLLYSGTVDQLYRKIRKVVFWAAYTTIPALTVLFCIGWIAATQPSVFWEDRLLVNAPLIAVPVFAVWCFTVPKLWRLRREIRRSAGPLDPETRGRLASPGTVLPFHAAAVGAATAFYFNLAAPFPFDVWEAASPLLLCLMALIGLWTLHDRRSRRVSRPDADIRHTRKSAARSFLGILCITAALGAVAVITAMQNSRHPDLLRMDSGPMDAGGGKELTHDAAPAVSVAMLTGPREQTPDRKVTLTAEKKTVRLNSGKRVEAWTFNGEIPGPELRFKKGELVEVRLLNRDIEDGVTLHWHGLDVPNAEDGVAGATQDAVMPGQSHTYRFVAEQAGTFWYHSHQNSQEAVSKGLFGALIVEGAMPERADFTVISHLWQGAGFAIGADDGVRRETVSPGTAVRLRLINTDDWVRQKYVLAGTSFKVAAIDGTDLNEPGELHDTSLVLTTGGRYDLTFTMPDRPVFLSVGEGRRGPGLLLSPDGEGESPVIPEQTDVFDPTHYGQPVKTPFSADSRFDRDFSLVLDNHLGFYNGRMDFLYSINGKVFPDTPMFMVREGELVRTTIVNRGSVDHPMHLHGHHMLVLSRNGEAADGSPWWSDTLDVQPGEIYEVAFRADNPGIWMDHCHNLTHAAAGMSMHLMYEGVTTPYTVGRDSVNRPE